MKLFPSSCCFKKIKPMVTLVCNHLLTIFLFFLRRTGKTKQKPEVIQDYNDYMDGVDRLDQLMAYYSFLHKSVKWWRKIFFWLLEVTVVNSYIIYKEAMKAKSRKSLPHKRFRKAVLNTLVEPMRTSGSTTRTRNPLNLERLRPQKHILAKGVKRRDCVVCSKRDGGGRHLTMYFCDNCRSKPSMCPAGCFTKYHTCKKFK